MKKWIKIFIGLVILIGGASMVFYTLQENSFPNKYADVLESYLGEYKTKKEEGLELDKSDKYDNTNKWEVQYGEQFKKKIEINDGTSFFTQLENMFLGYNYIQITEKTGLDNNSGIYLRNAYNTIPSRLQFSDFENSDSQIAKNYSKYYPKAFNLYDENNIDKLFTDQKTPLYFILVCKNKDIANQFIKNIKNVNAMIRIADDPLKVDEIGIETSQISEESDEYIFVYNGKVIENARNIMSQNTDYHEDDNLYEKGTVIYNYCHYLKENYEKQ